MDFLASDLLAVDSLAAFLPLGVLGPRLSADASSLFASAVRVASLVRSWVLPGFVEPRFSGMGKFWRLSVTDTTV